MKKRLINLIQNAPMTNVVYGDIKLPYPIHTANLTADYIIENGVIALPIKMGQRVYMQGINPEVPAIIEKIEILSHATYFYWAQYQVSEKYMTEVCLDCGCFSTTEIGKSVFLTENDFLSRGAVQ